jgi:hypothetical protein
MSECHYLVSAHGTGHPAVTVMCDTGVEVSSMELSVF